MRKFVRRSLFALLFAPALASAQSGTITGHIADTLHAAVAASVHVIGNPTLGGYAGTDGNYTITDVPVGQVRIEARFPGFKSETAAVTVTARTTVTQNFIMRQTAAQLLTINIRSARMNETKAAALEEQKTAPNIVTVESGDEIRSLPNANAAEAAARIPGVTTERDEGEGKFVEIRGTPPWFQNVEIDGVHIPGTLNGDRSVKLDDVPSDLLGAIEVTKTLTADQDANAIGGTVNLVSKIPEGAPRGYIAGQYSYQTLENNSQGQGSLTYGGRVGDNQRLGFLLGGSYDRTNRVIEDVEPFYGADNLQAGTFTPVGSGSNFNHYFPNDWSQREYNYYRTRYGFSGDLDYRFSSTSSIYLRGLWSAFFDQANRWETEVSGSNDVLGPGGVPEVTDGGVGEEISNRGPIEHTWGFTAGGKHRLGIVQLDYSANYAGSSATTHNHYDDKYSNDTTFTYQYGTSRLVPQYLVSGAVRANFLDPNAWTLSKVNVSNEAIDGSAVGAQANARVPFTIGATPATFQFGVKFTDEHKGDTPNNGEYDPGNNAPTLGQVNGAYRLNSFYSHICAGCYTLAPFGSISKLQTLIAAPGSGFTLSTDSIGNKLSSFSGTEQILAGYVMQTFYVGPFLINAGLRVENTNVGYVAYTDTTNDVAASVSQLNFVRNNHAYTDFFPSLHLRFAIDENTNLRFAFTRGIARPNYSDLAPTFSGNSALANSFTTGISAGNPALKPEHAWNYDLLAEHYFPSVGVLSAGVFYKSITDFIFTRTVPYTGQVERVPQFLPTDTSAYFISQPENGPSAWEYGVEADYTQHLTFLPGALRGIGFDVNWTWVNSRATVPGPSADTTVVGVRHAALLRQFPNIFNASLLYDYSAVSARLSGQYTAASIYQYGADGSSNPASSDTWNYPHWQIDGSIVWTVFGATALQAQVLNLNNAVFGFYNGNGTPGSGHGYNIQREYYGTTIYIGLRQGF